MSRMILFGLSMMMLASILNQVLPYSELIKSEITQNEDGSVTTHSEYKFNNLPLYLFVIGLNMVLWRLIDPFRDFKPLLKKEVQR